MYVLINLPITSPFPGATGDVREIPRENFDPTTMTRLGSGLTTAQQAALIPWSTVSPGWPFPINPE